MATTYNVNFAQGGTSNITIPRTFALSGFARTETPQWNSGRADRIIDTYISCRLSCTRDRTVTLNYYIDSGGVRLETGNFVKTMSAGSVYNCSAGLKNFSELTPAEVSAFIGGLSTATLTLNAGFSSGAELQLYKKGGVPFTFAIAFEDLEGSTFALDKTEYTSGDVPILTIEPMETTGTLTHKVRWTIGDYVGPLVTVSGTRATLAAIPDSFAEKVTSVSAPMALHCITYEDGVALGERVIDVTFTARDMTPTVTVTAAPLDGGTDYWQRFDGCRLSIVCNSAHSSHKSLTVSGDFAYDGDVVTSLNVPTFQTGGVKTFRVTYTNARDQVATQTVSINVNTLKPPVISLFDGQRYESGVDDEGHTVYKWSITSNKVRLKYAYSVDTAGGNISPSDIALTFRAVSRTVNRTSAGMSGAVAYNDTSATSTDKAILSALTFDASTEYVITFSVSDGKNTTTVTATIPKARVNLHIAASDYGVGIGTFAEGTSAANPLFVCEYPAEFRNGIKGIEIPVPVVKLDDTDSYSNANNALIIHDVTVEEAGWYHIWSVVDFSSNANGRRGFEVLQGNDVRIQYMEPPANGDATRITGSWFGYLTAGDVLHYRTYQTSGAALTVSVRRQLVKVF